MPITKQLRQILEDAPTDLAQDVLMMLNDGIHTRDDIIDVVVDCLAEIEFDDIDAIEDFAETNVLMDRIENQPIEDTSNLIDNIDYELEELMERNQDDTEDDSEVYDDEYEDEDDEEDDD